jgi:hypothetical protein
MLVRADIHALVDARSSEIWGADYETMLSEKHLVGAQQLVANVNRAGGWVTKSTFKLSELYHQEGIHVYCLLLSVALIQRRHLRPR